MGRYCKWARDVSHSPLYVAGGRLGRTSVEETLRGPLCAHFQPADMVFLSAGREDVDVRMLGRGRPFVVQLNNARTATATAAELGALQAAINAAGDGAVTVSGLRWAQRRDADAVKAAESSKRKTYRAVVWLQRPWRAEDVVRLAAVRDLPLAQRTPLRVLHRRTAGVRDKVVHRLRVRPINAHFALLDLETSAGTYVKEFVHGDFGRCLPNLGALLASAADIVQLDVLAVGMALPGDAEPGPDEGRDNGWPAPLPD